MFICNSSLLIFMQKYLFTELNIDFLIINNRANLIINKFFELLVIFYNIFLKMNVFMMSFLYHFLFFIKFYFDISNSRKFELILNICFLDVMNHNKIDKMIQFLSRNKFLFAYKVYNQHHFSYIGMILFLFTCEKNMRILNRSFNKLSKFFCLPICDLYRTVNKFK